MHVLKRLYLYLSHPLFRRASISFAALALMVSFVGVAQAGLVRAIIFGGTVWELSIYIAVSNILSSAVMALAVYVVIMFARAGAEMCRGTGIPVSGIDCVVSRWIMGRPVLSSSLVAAAMIAGSSITSAAKMAHILGIDPWAVLSALAGLARSPGAVLYIAMELSGYFLASISPSLGFRRAVYTASAALVLIACAAYLEASILLSISPHPAELGGLGS